MLQQLKCVAGPLARFVRAEALGKLATLASAGSLLAISIPRSGFNFCSWETVPAMSVKFTTIGHLWKWSWGSRESIQEEGGYKMLGFSLKMICGILIVQWVVLYYSTYFVLVLLWCYPLFQSRLKFCFKGCIQVGSGIILQHFLWCACTTVLCSVYRV